MDVSTEKRETQFKQDDKTENLRLANLRERRALFVALKFLSLHFVFILFYLFTVNISYLEYPLSRTFTVSNFLSGSFNILINFLYKSVL